MNSVTVAVAQQIATLNPKVEEAVTKVLVERELNKRSDAIVVVLDTLSKLENDLKKIKPDQISYDLDGKVTAETYSKAKSEEHKKLKEKIAKYTSAINKALEKADFGDVYNLKNQKQGGDGSSRETDTDSD